MKIFVNHTNHPSEQWGAAQRAAAEKFGEIVDIPFPAVAPNADEVEVLEMVNTNLREILKMKPAAVLCQGEFNYTFAMVEALKKSGVVVLAATSERVVEEIVDADGSAKKVSIFRFVRFRRYL